MIGGGCLEDANEHPQVYIRSWKTTPELLVRTLHPMPSVTSSSSTFLRSCRSVSMFRG